jgi:hypothetical protein
MQSNTVVLVRRFLAVLVLAASALLPSIATAHADSQKISLPNTFHVTTTDEQGVVSQVDLLEGGVVTITHNDLRHSYKVTGHAIDEGRVRLTIEEATESEPISAVETLVIVPGARPIRSPLTALSFAVKAGEFQSVPSPIDGTQDLTRDPTTETVCIKCSGRSYCCNPAPGWCCSVHACGWVATQCR